jgi:coproporphyrinogen III oxidase
VYLFTDQNHGKAINWFACGTDALPNVDTETMQWAFHEDAIEFAVAECAAGMGTAIVDGRDAIADAEHRNL